MRVSSKELFDKLGVGHVLGPYESCPWSAYDPAKGLTCSVDIHMAPGDEGVEAEGQLMHDAPEPGKPAMEQFFALRASLLGGQWEITTFNVRGQPYGQDRGSWQQFACDFVRLLAQALQADEVPNIDELLEEAFGGKDRVGGGGAGGGGRSVKMKNPVSALTLKRGR